MASLILVLVYSYFKGKKIIEKVNIQFDDSKYIYMVGEQYELKIHVPKQQIFEMRELSLTVNYYSVIRKEKDRVTKTLQLRRRENGEAVISYPLNCCDCITVNISEVQLDGLCGIFHFKKNVDFNQGIMVLPYELPILNGVISKEVEDYGNFKYLGKREDAEDIKPYLYLDLENLIYEEDILIRSMYLPLVYSISNSMLANDYPHRFLFGKEIFLVESYEDYLPVYRRIFQILWAARPLDDSPYMHLVTHAITTGKGLPIPNYRGKTIALIYDEDDITEDYLLTEYVRVTNAEEDILNLTL